MKTPPIIHRSLACGLFLLVSQTLIPNDARADDTGDKSAKRCFLYDDKPALLDLKGWETRSFPLGNGYFGVSFFGGVGEELWQFCEKSLFVADPANAE